MEERIIIDSKFNFGNVVATTPLFEYCRDRGLPFAPLNKVNPCSFMIL